MTSFELCSGLLYRNLFYLRLACAVFERTSIVMPSMLAVTGAVDYGAHDKTNKSFF